MINWLYNSSKKTHNVTIIIPTYKNTKFLMECLNSVLVSAKKCSNYEVLLGIDNCYETLKLVSNKIYLLKENVKIFFFPKNVGPYVIRNTLAQKAKYEDILFFDSDDIMMENTLETLLGKFKDKKILKFKFYNFYDGKDYKDIENLQISPIFSHGVFLIKKDKLLSMNGFFGWKMGADAEFDERCAGNGHNIAKLDIPIYYRRYHDFNLTRRSETGINSPLRHKYSNIILQRRNAKNWTNPEKIDIFDTNSVL
jgi:glycosyltransferase involved in cell wall biosynthesis